ncbi:MAG TPA: F0F1 ATP synthase subunit B [Saprospiraceae bacterium]|nr:F0F1 ATP synthase subunit B [Saprospiraceae bacterium]
MFYLMDFDPIKPDIGLIFWTTVIFLLFWGIVGRFAFKPIASALRKRELDIQSSLDQARLARQEMANLKAENEKLLASAREERARMLKDAKDAGEQIVQESKYKARDEAQKIVTSAKAEIESQKKQALIEVKNQVGNMALDIAEQVLRLKLKDDQAQQTLVNTLVKEIKLN